MTKEERELLIKDLCARLPYGLKGLVTTHWDKEYVGILKGIKSGPMLDIPQLEIMYDYNIHNVGLGDFKPYLRPLNNITPKESREFQYIFNNIYRPSVSMIDKNCEYHKVYMTHLNLEYYDIRYFSVLSINCRYGNWYHVIASALQRE